MYHQLSVCHSRSFRNMACLSRMRCLARYTSISVLLILILCLNICYALYEDQVGLFDWRQKFIGKVKFAYFNQYSHSSRRALVATESNVIAALNARTGSIIWRKVFENKHGNVDALLHHANTFISVSGSGKMLRSWEQSKGHLQWEVGKIENNRTKKKVVAGFPGWGISLVSKSTAQTSTNIASLYNNIVSFNSIKDGAEIWNWKPEQEGKDTNGRNCLALYSSSEEVFVLVQKNEVYFEIVALNPQTGFVKRSKSIPAPWLVDNATKCAVIGNWYITCLNVQDFELVVIDLSEIDMTITTTRFSKLSLSLESHKDLDIKPLGEQYVSNEFIVTVPQHSRLLFKINSKKNVELVHEFAEDALLIPSNDKKYLISIDTKDSKHTINMFDLNGCRKLDKLTQTLSSDNFHGKAEYASMYVFTKKDGELGYRLLVAFEDHALCLIQQSGVVLWEREEALAGIASVEMVELPASTSTSKVELLHEEFASVPNSGIFSKFIKRVKIQLKQLELLMASLKKKRNYGLQDPQFKEQSKELTRDQFGLHKIIVALTDAGKLFGLDTAKGKILWSRYLTDLSPYNVQSEEKMMLYVQRTTAHFPLPPQCVVVGKKKSGHGTLVYAFNPMTGQPADSKNKEGITFPYDIVQVSLLPLTDENFCKAILLVDNQLKIHIFPETGESVSHLYEKVNSIFLHLADKEKNLVRGFALKAGKQTGKEVASVQEAWSVKFPDDQLIHKIVYKRLDEHVHSVGRVLGDRSVLYKYLNPNLIAFATVMKESLKPSTFIYVIDAVTGQIVYQARHRSARGPVQMVLSENWLVYLLYNTKTKRTEASVVEMYEGFEERNSTAFSSLESLDHPFIMSQGYLLPITRADAMAVTNTERGITHKNILLAMENGYIYSVPKNHLDPRRSFEQTPQLAEEGLLPYLPKLLVHPMDFVNYNMTVDRVRGIHTSAAGLESTSLVLAYGLDLYFTRITPSKLFDVLKEDFDYIFISGVLSALILGAIISSKLASIWKLSFSWL